MPKYFYSLHCRVNNLLLIEITRCFPLLEAELVKSGIVEIFCVAKLLFPFLDTVVTLTED